MVTEPATLSPADRMYTVELALKKKKNNLRIHLHKIEILSP